MSGTLSFGPQSRGREREWAAELVEAMNAYPGRINLACLHPYDAEALFAYLADTAPEVGALRRWCDGLLNGTDAEGGPAPVGILGELAAQVIPPL